MTIQKHEYLYQQIAKDIADSIKRGEYQVGERLLSLRAVCDRYGVSLATAIQAYQLLQDQELVTVRAKSGYRVQNGQSAQITAPEMSQPQFKSMPVNVSQLAMSLVNETRQTGLIKLGAAVPAPEMLPLATLARTTAGTARRLYQEMGSYADTQGYMPLRQQIVRLMREAGVRCHRDDIIITNGCLEALSLALRVVAKPGDTIAIESPTYFGVLQVIEALGLRALELPTDVVQGINVNTLEQAISKRQLTACVLMPSFANPTGASMPDANRKRVVELLAGHKIPLIEDDVCGILSYDSVRPKALKSYDNEQMVIYCSSFSKTVAPGLRIGWIVAGIYKKPVIYRKFLDNISTSILPQMALAELLAKTSYRRKMRQVASVYRLRMDRLRYWVARYFPAGTRISNPAGGFLLWVELPKKIDCLTLYHQAMEKKIATTPGVLFSVQGQYNHHLRLSCGAVEGELAEKSIKKLAVLMSKK